MITKFKIKKKKDENILYLYFDFQYEIASLNKPRKKSIKEEIIEYINRKKIIFNGKKIVIVLGSIVIGTLFITTPITKQETNDIYVNKILLTHFNEIEDTNKEIEKEIKEIETTIKDTKEIENDTIKETETKDTSENNNSSFNNTTTNSTSSSSTNKNNTSTTNKNTSSNSNTTNNSSSSSSTNKNNTSTTNKNTSSNSNTTSNNSSSSNTNKNNTSTTNKNTSSNSNTTSNSSSSSNTNKNNTSTTNKNTSSNSNTTSNSSSSSNTNNNQSTTSTISSNIITIYRSNGTVLKIELEEYLIGVVAEEMPASFNIEALKAQAIVARTYALKSISQGKKLTDTVDTQVYKDNSQLKQKWGSSYNTYYQKIKNAVDSTKGMVITYQGNLIDATYFSTSNGYTEDAVMVWGNDIPYLRSVESTWDKNTTSYLRNTTLTYEEISKKLGFEVSKETEIKIEKRNESNRVLQITIANKSYTGVELRTLLGLRSADFDIDQTENSVTFTTRGYGHGVGMSQYGANEMAKNGYTYSQIITHYYQGVKIIKK